MCKVLTATLILSKFCRLSFPYEHAVELPPRVVCVTTPPRCILKAVCVGDSPFYTLVLFPRTD